MTQAGMILGTAAYMAPEQAKGQPVDKRADIWAFGCVLYEMLTGRRAFGGEDVSDTLAAVLRSDPDWQALPSDLPPAVRLLIERSLVKDRRRRMADISTALFLLNETLPLAPLSAGPAVRLHMTGRLVAAAVIGLAAGAALATLVIRGIERPAAPVTQRLSLALPDDRAIGFGPLPGSSLAISPDGTSVAFVSPNPGAPTERISQLRVRSLTSLGVVDLPGTFLAHQPFFSPDGGSVAFFTPSGELKKISVAGGNPVTLVDKINGSSWAFGVWVDPDTIVFGAFGTGGLRQVPADGGPLKEITSLDAAQGEVAHMPTAFVPEAGALVFTTSFSQLRGTQIETVILGSGERRVIIDNAGSGRYLSTGHLLFRRGDANLVAPFDVERLALAGPAVALSEDVRRDGANSEGSVPQLAVSSNGTLAYVRSAGISANSNRAPGSSRRILRALQAAADRPHPKAPRLSRRSTCRVRGRWIRRRHRLRDHRSRPRSRPRNGVQTDGVRIGVAAGVAAGWKGNSRLREAAGRGRHLPQGRGRARAACPSEQ